MITRRRTVEDLDPTSALLEVVRLAFEEGVAIDNLKAEYRRSTSRTKTLTEEEHSEVSSPTSERGQQAYDRAWSLATNGTPSNKEHRGNSKQQAPSQTSPGLGSGPGLVTKLVPGGPCSHCSCTLTPQWRRPKGRDMVLCNACGIYFSRYNKMPPRKPLTENQSAPLEPSHAELVLRADATGPHSRAMHEPVSTTSTTPAHVCGGEEEDISFSPLRSKQPTQDCVADGHINGAAVAVATDTDMDVQQLPRPQAQHSALTTASPTQVTQQQPGVMFRRHLNALPHRTASMPLLGGAEHSVPLPRTSSRRREKNCRLAQYDDPSNMELADDAEAFRSAPRPAYSHSGSKGCRANSAATSKLRRQRDSDSIDNTSGDSDVSTGAGTPNGHERRAHRASANLSTLGPHHVSPQSVNPDQEMHVAGTGEGTKLAFSGVMEAYVPRRDELLQREPQQNDSQSKTLPQSIPYISAPAPETHTASYVAPGSSAGSSLEDVQYLSRHPLLPFATAVPLLFQPCAPFSAILESPPTLSSIPSVPLFPGHMPYFSHLPQRDQLLTHVSQQQQQQHPPQLFTSSHPQQYEDRSSNPEIPMPSTSTPSGSQTSTLTPQPRLIAPCRSRGPSVRSGGGILGDPAEHPVDSIYSNGT